MSAPTSQVQLLEESVDTVAGRILLNMKVSKLNTRCYQNKVHYVLSTEHEKDSLLTSPAVRSLLAKTPKFIPTPRRITAVTISSACDLFGYRLIKNFNRYIRRKQILEAEVEAKDVGIKQWKPKQFPHRPEYFKNYINDFFKPKSNFDGLWDRNWDRCPSLQVFIRQFKSNRQRLSDPIGRHAKVKHNLTKEEGFYS